MDQRGQLPLTSHPTSAVKKVIPKVKSPASEGKYDASGASTFRVTGDHFWIAVAVVCKNSANMRDLPKKFLVSLQRQKNSGRQMRMSAVPIVLVHLLGSHLPSPATFITGLDLTPTFPITNFQKFVLNKTGEVTGVVSHNHGPKKYRTPLIIINCRQSCIFSILKC